MTAHSIALLLLGRICANLGISANEFAELTVDADEPRDIAVATRTLPPSAPLH